MVLDRFFGRGTAGAPARDLYAAIVAQARQPAFYAQCAVPDTVDGRFDLIALHAFLVLHRLKRDHPRSAELAQALFDTMFLDMDENLRELGVGDMSVGRRVKQMAQGLYGRIAAYEAGMEAGDSTLMEALRRNLYGTAEPSAACIRPMAAYMRDEAAALAAQSYGDLARGAVTFGAPPCQPS